MKDYLADLVAPEANPLRRKNLVREYLQARILQGLQEHRAFLNWAFLGGTALRFLYSMPRYSEDLDFSVVHPKQDHRFRELLERLKLAFEAEAYSVKIKVSDAKTVCSAFLCFEGLLFELGISSRRHEMLSVRIEIDTNPPLGANTITTIIRRYVTVNILHYDKPSLLAGKLHAVLTRKYTKGRDLYDLVWYLSDITWPAPNYELLNAALQQTGWRGKRVTENNWRDLLKVRLSQLDWERAAADVRPFLERDQDAALVTEETCLKLLTA